MGGMKGGKEQKEELGWGGEFISLKRESHGPAKGRK